MTTSAVPSLCIQHDFTDQGVFRLEKECVVIGSASGCDIGTESSRLAPRHAELRRHGAQVILRDLGTPDGTFVNSIPVTGEIRLKHADIIQICDYILLFQELECGNEEQRIGSAGKFGFPELAEVVSRLKENIGKVFKGKSEVVRNLTVTLLADGHLLLEDAPGVGKSLIAQALARSIHAAYRRIQFTPDMMPSDITGMSIYDNAKGQFRFVPGPVFGNVILADEINRTTPRTQSSLLECMAEGSVSVDGRTRILPKPFFVIATQNPEDYHGTYPLPEPQLDRFMMRMSIGYPTPDLELQILSGSQPGAMLHTISGVLRADEIIRAQSLVRQVEVAESIKRYIIEIAGATREHQALVNGISPRATLALMRAAQSLAACEGRDYVTPHDVRDLVIPVLSHRLSLKLRWKGQFQSVANVLNEILQKIKLPNERR